MVKRSSFEEVLGRNRVYDASILAKKLINLINDDKVGYAESLFIHTLRGETSYYIDCVVEALTRCDWYNDGISTIGYLWPTDVMVKDLCKAEIKRNHKFYVHDFCTNELLWIAKCSSRGPHKF